MDVNFTEDEQRFFGELFSSIDVENAGKVTLSMAAEVFARSSLPRDVIQKVICLSLSFFLFLFPCKMKKLSVSFSPIYFLFPPLSLSFLPQFFTNAFLLLVTFHFHHLHTFTFTTNIDTGVTYIFCVFTNSYTHYISSLEASVTFCFFHLFRFHFHFFSLHLRIS